MNIIIEKALRPLRLCRACDIKATAKLGIVPPLAFDRLSAGEANMLVENREDALCLEITSDTEIRFGGDFVAALTGARFSASVNGQTVPMYCAFQTDRGDLLTLAGNCGCLYLAVNGVIGGECRSLTSGDSLEVADPAEALVNMDLRAIEPKTFGDSVNLRMIPSPSAAKYDEKTLTALYTREFTVEAVCGCFVTLASEGNAVKCAGKSKYPIYSPAGGVVVGDDNLPRISLPCVPLTSNEICAGIIIGCDMQAAAQLYEGCRVTFSPCTVEAAQRLASAQRSEYLRSYIAMNSYDV